MESVSLASLSARLEQWAGDDSSSWPRQDCCSVLQSVSELSQCTTTEAFLNLVSVPTLLHSLFVTFCTHSSGSSDFLWETIIRFAVLRLDVSEWFAKLQTSRDNLLQCLPMDWLTGICECFEASYFELDALKEQIKRSGIERRRFDCCDTS